MFLGPCSARSIALLCFASVISASSLRGQALDDLGLAWERYVLTNGLEVVLLPDSTQDEVAVELWTHVGTRHEPVGKGGLAHFFEHVFPHGSLLRAPAIAALADSLRTDSNARTRADYTRYYQQTTREGAELFLLMAAARLASDPANDLTAERLERQRGRVLVEMDRFRETRWGEPVTGRIALGTFGAMHPYGRGAYGTSEETHSITRDDLARWHRAHVRPEYTTLFVAGGFDPELIRGFIESVFGRIPGGTRPTREAPRVPDATGGHASLSVVASESLLFLVWPTPQWAHEHTPLLELFGHALGERLAEERPPGVETTSVEPIGREIAGSFTIAVAHEPAVDVEALEAWVRRTLDDTLANLSEVEVAAARTAVRARVRSYLDQLGWIGSRIDLVGEGLMYSNDPGGYLDQLARQRNARPVGVTDAARAWLTGPAFVLTVDGAGGVQ